MQLFPLDQAAQNYRIKRVLLGFAFYTLCGMIVAFSAWQGFYPLFPLAAYTVAYLAASALFFMTTWLGWNLRFKEPSLTEAQILCSALLCTYVLAYAGPLRGVYMQAYIIGLMFAGTQLRMRQLARLALAPVLLYPIAAFVAALQASASFDWRIEFVNWVSLCLILIFTVILVGNLSRLHARLSDMVVHDELTGLYNRRHLTGMLEYEKSRAGRSADGVFCVCLLDIDHFKRINDTYGHGDGDTVLRTLAKVAEQEIRNADILGRWGGEEFLLILPQTSIELAATCVERIRVALERTAFDGLPAELRVTLSVGIAQYQREETIKSLIERADHALYDAKRNGRNRVVMAAPAQERAVSIA